MTQTGKNADVSPSYSSDSPQVRAAKASGEARRQRACGREERAARHLLLHAYPGVPGHPWICVCDDCQALRPPEARI